MHIVNTDLRHLKNVGRLCDIKLNYIIIFSGGNDTVESGQERFCSVWTEIALLNRVGCNDFFRWVIMSL